MWVNLIHQYRYFKISTKSTEIITFYWCVVIVLEASFIKDKRAYNLFPYLVRSDCSRFFHQITSYCKTSQYKTKHYSKFSFLSFSSLYT